MSIRVGSKTIRERITEKWPPYFAKPHIGDTESLGAPFSVCVSVWLLKLCASSASMPGNAKECQ
jgi:hypothetical protein